MKVFIPENLDLNRFITERPPKFKPFHKDKLAYIIGLVWSIKSRDKRLINCRGVPINANFLKQRVHNYSDYLTYLTELEIFYTNGSYFSRKNENTYSKVQSRCYGFTDKYCTPVREYDILQYSLLKALKKKNKEEAKKEKDLEEKYPYIKYVYEIDIDIDSADFFTKRRIDVARGNGWIKAFEKWNYNYVTTHTLFEGGRENIYCIMDNKVGRLHTLPGGVKKCYRKYFSYNGQKLVSVDISNCQLLLLTALFRPEFYRVTDSSAITMSNLSIPYMQNFQISDAEQLQYPNNPPSLSNTSIPLMIPLYQMLPIKPNDSEDFSKYIKLVVEGSFFDYISDKYVELTKKPKPTKKQMKTKVFSALYSRTTTQNEIKQLLYNEFSGPFRLFESFKTKDYTILPCMMQTIEADLMLTRVGRRISSERPGLFILPIHDCLVTTQGNEDYIASVIEEETKKAIGFTPTLKIEPW